MDKEKHRGGAFDPLLNIALLLPAIVLALVAFFAMQEVVLTLAARVIIATVDGAVRGSYALGTVRNFWLIGGGMFLVGFVIYLLDSAFKHWRSRRLRRLLLRALAFRAGDNRLGMGGGRLAHAPPK